MARITVQFQMSLLVPFRPEPIQFVIRQLSDEKPGGSFGVLECLMIAG